MIRSYLIHPIVLLLLTCGAQELAAQGKGDSAPVVDGGAALIFGDRHALTLRAPEKWVVDSKSGKAQGLQAVFYPNGERWSKSPAVMYCQVVARGKDIKDVRAMMEYDQARFRNSSPTAIVVDQPAIPFTGGRKALARRFSGGTNGAIEQVAYIEERTVVVMVILSCRTQEAFDSSLGAFNSLVGSYRFLADDQENIQRALEAAGL